MWVSSPSAAAVKAVDNKSSVARLYTIIQKNHDLNVILRKAQGMVNCKFVRAIVIEALLAHLRTLWHHGRRHHQPGRLQALDGNARHLSLELRIDVVALGFDDATAINSRLEAIRVEVLKVDIGNGLPVREE